MTTMQRLAAVLIVSSVVISACGGKSSSPTSPTTPTTPTASTAVVTVTPFVVSVEPSGANFTYHLRFTLNETSGRSAATVTSIALVLANGNSTTAPFPGGIRIPPGGAYDSGAIDTTDSTGRGNSATMSVNVVFNDDGGHGGSASATANVAAIQRFALTGFVRDRTTNANLSGATVTVTSGPDTDKAVTTNGGYYAFAALQAGTFNIRATAAGHDAATQSVTLGANVQVDLTVAPSAPPAPVVEYRITGTARRCDATYENSSHGTNQATVDIPFSYTWSSARSGDFLYMSCQISTGGDRGNITIGLYKSGRLVQSADASGFPNIATVSGLY